MTTVTSRGEGEELDRPAAVFIARLWRLHGLMQALEACNCSAASLGPSSLE